MTSIMSHLLSNKEVIQNIMYRKILLKSIRQKSYFPMFYFLSYFTFIVDELVSDDDSRIRFTPGSIIPLGCPAMPKFP
jgi:hypothetical protein